MPRTIAIVLILLLYTFLAPRAVSAADYVWLEAEDYDRCNFPHFERSSMGKPQLLSGGEWLMRGVKADEVPKLVPDEGIILEYAFDVPKAGRYNFWARVGWYSARADFKWRISDGPWKAVPPSYPTTNLMELGFFCEVSWADLGKVKLEQGANTLQIRYPKAAGENAKMLVAADCFALMPGKFTPEGALKPSETYDRELDRRASEHVFALPVSRDSERTEEQLNGLWQVARYDDPNMDVDTYEPIHELPSPDEYPLRWMAFNAPGSPWDHEPLVFGHRLIYRTRVDVPAEHDGRGFKLHFSGTNWIVSVFINGKLAGTHRGVWVPWDLDVSEFIKPGQVNEIALAVKGSYYAFDAKAMGKEQTLEKLKNRPESRRRWARWVAPIDPSTKGDGDGYVYGIVNPVTFVSVGDAYTEDVFIKPSVENKSLSLEYTLRNTTPEPRRTHVVVEAVHDATGQVEKTWKLTPPALEPNQSVTFDADDLPWTNPKLWWPKADPDLYRLRTTIVENGKTIDVHEELFGFREVSIRRTGVYINGVRRNVWCWVDAHVKWVETPEEWLEAFHEDGNRFTRFSKNRRISRVIPTREGRLEFYDRHGIPGRLCTMIDGMRISYNLGERTRDENGDPLLVVNDIVWENFREHMAQVAKAYRNHPSIIFHQVENELVYINGMNIYGGYLDRVEELTNEVVEAGRAIDPTRPYTVGGGGDLSGRLEINSPHYPHAAFDYYPENAYTLNHYSTKIERWPWDRTKPWIVGESCFANHLEFATVAIGGEAYRGHDYARMGKARFLRMLYGGYRYAGVAGFFPWDNLYDFEDSRKVFSALAAIPRKQTHRLYGGKQTSLLFKVMNDTLSDAPVTLAWEYGIGDRLIASDEQTLHIEPGFGEEHEIVIDAPKTDRRLDGTLTLRVTQNGATPYVDERSVPTLPGVEKLATPRQVYLLDRQGEIADWLTRTGISFEQLERLSDVRGKQGLLIIGHDTLTADEAFGPEILMFAAEGGSVISLEQEHPPAGAALPMPVWPTTRKGGFAHPEVLGTPVLHDLGREDLIDWAGEHPTFKKVYRKPSGGARSLASAGESLQFSPLIEAPCGKGVIVLCQMRVGANLGVDPAADCLLRNMIEVYGGYTPSQGVASVYLSHDPLTRAKLDETGLLLEDVSNVTEALDADQFRVAIVEASPANIETLNRISSKVEAFQAAGGWIMLTGLGPKGGEAFNRLVGADHILRPFRAERVTLDQSTYKLAATLGHRDVALYSPNKIMHTTYWVSPHTFSHVIDNRDFAPFTIPPNASDDPMEFQHPWEHDHPDREPYNLVNGMFSRDDWRYTHMIWIDEGKDHHDLVFRLRRSDVLGAVKLWNNTTYHTIAEVDVILDGDAEKTYHMDVPAANEPIVLELPEPVELKETITLRITRWRNDSHRAFEDGILCGIDNLQFLRPEECVGKGIFLDTAGGLVACPGPSGGGVFLNQVQFLEEEPKVENDAKKLKIVGTVLQNMGVGTRTASVLPVPGVNVRFHPVTIQEHANAYLADTEGREGWFHHRPNLPEGLNVFPRGESILADVTYSTVNFTTSPIPDFILLGGERSRLPKHLAEMPSEVRDIPVRRKADQLYFLHTAHITNPISDRERARMTDKKNPFVLPTVMEYVLHYTDGQTAQIPVVLERNIDHWVQKEATPLLGARVGWSRRFDSLEGQHAVIYSMQADNPRPDVEIESIEIRRTENRGAFAVLAITAGEVVQ
ncbi:MAG: glycosyl hydrolase 2 galactose-binding domain-containing protein [Planctomycetota bacterium]